MPMGILNAVLIMDAGVRKVLKPIIGIPVTQTARVETAETIVGDEKRPAIVGSKRKFDAVIGLAIAKTATRGKSVMIDIGLYRVPF